MKKVFSKLTKKRTHGYQTKGRSNNDVRWIEITEQLNALPTKIIIIIVKVQISWKKVTSTGWKKYQKTNLLILKKIIIITTKCRFARIHYMPRH